MLYYVCKMMILRHGGKKMDESYTYWKARDEALAVEFATVATIPLFLRVRILAVALTVLIPPVVVVVSVISFLLS